MFDFGGNLNQAMGIILAYTGRISFFGVTLTEMIIALIVFPWAIYFGQGLWKVVSPVPVEFDSVTGSQYDPDWNDQRDEQAIDNYVNGVYDPESSGAISRHRASANRKRQINRYY